MSDLELRAAKAEAAKNELSVMLFVCAVIAGWALGGWGGFLVFLVFAAIAANA